MVTCAHCPSTQQLRQKDIKFKASLGYKARLCCFVLSLNVRYSHFVHLKISSLTLKLNVKDI